MAQPTRSIPIDHDPIVHAVDAAAHQAGKTSGERIELTLLELVQAISEVTESEHELLATVIFILRSGRVRLAGNFREASLDELCR